jgi:hypothetical protein
LKLLIVKPKSHDKVLLLNKILPILLPSDLGKPGWVERREGEGWKGWRGGRGDTNTMALLRVKRGQK